jgi:hypothetical protein
MKVNPRSCQKPKDPERSLVGPQVGEIREVFSGGEAAEGFEGLGFVKGFEVGFTRAGWIPNTPCSITFPSDVRE